MQVAPFPLEPLLTGQPLALVLGLLVRVPLLGTLFFGEGGGYKLTICGICRS